MYVWKNSFLVFLPSFQISLWVLWTQRRKVMGIAMRFQYDEMVTEVDVREVEIYSRRWALPNARKSWGGFTEKSPLNWILRD